MELLLVLFSLHESVCVCVCVCVCVSHHRKNVHLETPITLGSTPVVDLSILPGVCLSNVDRFCQCDSITAVKVATMKLYRCVGKIKDLSSNLGVVQPMSAEYSCDVVMTTEYSWVGASTCQSASQLV